MLTIHDAAAIAKPHNDLIIAQGEIDRLRRRIAALSEIVREGACPVDGRVTVAECQQCGCSLGLLLAEIPTAPATRERA